MTYPFEFREMLLTSEALDVLGFSEYWGDAGDSGTRTLNLGGIVGDERLTSKGEYPLYHIHEIDEKEEGCDGYCLDSWYEPYHIVSKGWENLYFLHEMYEDILARRTPEEIEKFIEITKQKYVNMYSYIKSYIEYVEKNKLKEEL